jgi:hypothetical protein
VTGARAAVALAALAACGHDRSAAAPTGSSMSQDTQLIVTPAGDAWSLSFTIRNPGSAPLAIRYMHPFTGFQLAVADGRGAALSLGQPALDIPVQPKELVVPGDSKGVLQTPIRLRFAADAPPTGGGTDPFVWTIRAAPQPVTLTATVDLSGLGARTASAALKP